ncbi:MAG: hypothetical protein IJC38_04995 [Erysipelotrichaceae bacterium]|nr:hypothetical protein [Erysipelotrichaceae bacterium]
MCETIVRCPMCPNHCDVRRLRCIRGRQWQARQRARMVTNSVQKTEKTTQKTEQK